MISHVGWSENVIKNPQQSRLSTVKTIDTPLKNLGQKHIVSDQERFPLCVDSFLWYFG